MPTNIRLGWKGLPGTNALAIYQKIVTYGRKKFYNIGHWFSNWNPVQREEFGRILQVNPGRHDIQYNDIQHNDIQHNDIQHNDIQHNDIQHNDIQHNDIQHNDI